MHQMSSIGPLHQSQMIYEPAYFLTNGIPTLIELSHFLMKPLLQEILISILMMKKAQMQYFFYKH